MVPKPATRANSVTGTETTWSRRGSSILPSLSWKKVPEVQIVLDGEQKFVPTYSTFDEITGHVNLKFEKDVEIDDIAICFQGQTNTWIEKVATTSPVMGKATGKHTFLRVQQPIDPSCLPPEHRAVAGVTYTIPFKFVVPERILDFICSHKTAQSVVKDAHLQLPPSIGDPMLSGVGNMLMDDLAPKMAKINYCIRVGIIRASSGSHKPDVITEELGIRIVPVREEAPPLTVDNSKRGYEKYRLRKEKNVRKGIFKLGKKQGRLTAETVQPSSLKLRHPLNDCDEPITTMTTVNFRYDPASVDEQPPSLNSISNKLKIHTFFGAAPWQYFPAPGGVDIYSTLHSHYPDSIDLSSRNLTNVEWTRHDPGPSARSNSVPMTSPSDKRSSRALSTSVPSTYSSGTHGSRSTAGRDFTRRQSTFSVMSAASGSTTSSSEDGNESSSSDSPSSSPSQASSSSNLATSPLITSPSTAYDPSLPYYTTTVLVPITLPATSAQALSPTAKAHPNKPKKVAKPITFLPTFHSCLISRIYSLDLSVHVASTPTINLRLPLQVSLPYDPTATRRSTNVSAPSPFVVSDDSAQPPAFFDPDFTFATEGEPGTDHDIDVNDEAIAQFLDNEHRQHSHHRPRDLGDVPEYEDTYPVVGGGGGVVGVGASTGTSTTTRATRHLSLLPPDVLYQQRQQQRGDQHHRPTPDAAELPPAYDTTVRRSSVLQQQQQQQQQRSNSRSLFSTSPAATTGTGTGTGTGTVTTATPRVHHRPMVVRYVV